MDGVTDPHNLGALLRSAEAAGATGAVLPRHRAVHVTPTVAKAAAGAVERVPMAIVAGIPAALARAKELGCWVVGLAGDGDQSLFDGLAVADEAIVLVMGAEGAGLSRLARARCDLVVSIPMRGRLASLNVSTAGALALFESHGDAKRPLTPRRTLARKWRLAVVTSHLLVTPVAPLAVARSSDASNPLLIRSLGRGAGAPLPRG